MNLANLGKITAQELMEQLGLMPLHNGRVYLLFEAVIFLWSWFPVLHDAHFNLSDPKCIT